MNFEAIEQAMRDAREKTFQSSGQFDLGALTDACESIARSTEDDPDVVFDFEYAHPVGIASWRGIYAELALRFEMSGDRMPLSAFIAMLKKADGDTFEGYKGGDFTMGRITPIWVANYGHSGNTAVIGVLDAGYQVVIQTGYREP